jgi:hypothetical protein
MGSNLLLLTIGIEKEGFERIYLFFNRDFSFSDYDISCDSLIATC